MAENQKIIYGKLMKIQNELKAPKGQYNSFGGYSYRSCEDILEAVKPIAAMNDCFVTLSDEIVQIGTRYYIKSTVTLIDTASGQTIENTALAREPESKTKMDDAQVTGTSSSYARKYALNGLFAIDDTKDADTDEHHKQTNPAPKQAPKPQQKPKTEAPKVAPKEPAKLASEAQITKIWTVANAIGMSKDGVHFLFKNTGKQSVKDLTTDEAKKVIDWLEDKQRQKAEMANG